MAKVIGCEDSTKGNHDEINITHGCVRRSECSDNHHWVQVRDRITHVVGRRWGNYCARDGSGNRLLAHPLQGWAATAEVILTYTTTALPGVKPALISRQ